MGIIRLSELEPWIGVQKPAEESGASPLDAAWAKAAAAATTVDTAATAFGGLDKAANDLEGGAAPPAEWSGRFDDAVGKLPMDGLADDDFADFQALARMRGTRLKVAAVRRQHQDIASRFEDALDGYVQKAADAPSDAIEATFRNQAIRAIERIDGAGLLGPGVADRLRAELPARIDRALAQRAIERDPAHAAALLTQPGALPALDDAERARLARKAGIRAERQGHEKALADESHRAGTVAGLWSQLDTLDDTDIDAAEADGRLLAGEAQDLRQRLQVERDARQQRTDAIARVTDVLAGEGALDPSSPGDRKAVDAHFAETERGWNDSQVAAELRPALIGAYVGRTGILPPALKDRIGAAFRAGDATRQNEASDIVEAIGTSAGPGALKDMALDDLLQSALIRSLRKSGLDPAAAAARATAIVGGDAQARDHNFRRDLAAAGRWAEESGGFDDEQIGELREGLDGLIKLPDRNSAGRAGQGALQKLPDDPNQDSGPDAQLPDRPDGGSAALPPGDDGLEDTTTPAGEAIAESSTVSAEGTDPPLDPEAALEELRQVLTSIDPEAEDEAQKRNVERILVAAGPFLHEVGPGGGGGRWDARAAFLSGFAALGALLWSAKNRSEDSAKGKNAENYATKPQVSPYMTPAPPRETKLENIPDPDLNANEPLVTPVPDPIWDQIPDGIPSFGPEDRVNVLIFENLGDKIPQIWIVESRGGKDVQQLNTDLGRLCEEMGKEIGRPLKHTGGALDGKGVKLTETYLPPGGKWGTGTTKGSSRVDVTCTDQETGRRALLESVTPEADGVTPNSREQKQASAKLINKKDGDILVLLPKPPNGATLDWEKARQFLRPIFEEIGRDYDPGRFPTNQPHLYVP